jgi:acetyltransferase-like isoleucine patch superfamily enzyme
MSDVFIHPTAEVSKDTEIGSGTKIWANAQVREGVHIGSECILGRNVYVDFGVSIGDRVKIQNNVSVFHGVTIEDGVFIGPHVCFTNDVLPRAITPDGKLKSADDWEVTPIRVKYGASLGANSTIVPGVTIGSFALVGSGSVVSRDVPDQGLVYGNPARLRGYVCKCGHKLIEMTRTAQGMRGTCPECHVEYTLAAAEAK